MSKLSITRFLLPSILIISLANLGVSIFQLSKPTPSTIKYVDNQRMMQRIFKEIQKTMMEMMAPRFKEQEVLHEQINSLEQKKKVKGYLGKAAKKELEEKQLLFKSLTESIGKEEQEQFQKMLLSKIAKVEEIITNMAEKNNYTIQVQIMHQNQFIKTAIAKQDNVTDLVLAELGVAVK